MMEITFTDIDLQLSKELKEALLEKRIDPALVDVIGVNIDGQPTAIYRYNEEEVTKRLEVLKGTSAYEEIHAFHTARRAAWHATVAIPPDTPPLVRPHCCVCNHDGNVLSKDGIWYCAFHWDAWMEYYGISTTIDPSEPPEFIWQKWYDQMIHEQARTTAAEAWM